MAVRPDRVVRVEEDGGTLPAPFPPGAGLARLEDDFVMVLDADRVFSLEELTSHRS